MAQTIYGQNETISFVIAGGAAAADYQGVIPIPYAWELVSFTERHGTLGTDGGAVTLSVEKVPSATAQGSGTNMLQTEVNLKAANDTNQSGVLSATAADYQGAAGDGIALKLTGTPTSVDAVAAIAVIKRR